SPARAEGIAARCVARQHRYRQYGWLSRSASLVYEVRPRTSNRRKSCAIVRPVHCSPMVMKSSASAGVAQTEFTISDLAREFDLTPRAIRFYEDEGLLAPVRAGSRRIYHNRDRVR